MSTPKRSADPRSGAPADAAWRADLESLRAISKRDLPSVTDTERTVLASATHPSTPYFEENRIMSIAKRRPLVMGLALAAIMLVLVPVSYALVTKIFLSVDTDLPAEELEEDIRGQLEAAGVSDPSVAVREDGDQMRIAISSERLTAGDVEIGVKDGKATREAVRIALAISCDLPEDRMSELEAVAESDELSALITVHGADLDDDALVRGLRERFAASGFETHVVLEDAQIRIDVTGEIAE